MYLDGVALSISISRDGDGGWSALGTYMALINQRGAFSLYLAQYGEKTGHSTLKIKGNWYLALLTVLQSGTLAICTKYMYNVTNSMLFIFSVD